MPEIISTTISTAVSPPSTPPHQHNHNHHQNDQQPPPQQEPAPILHNNDDFVNTSQPQYDELNLPYHLNDVVSPPDLDLSEDEDQNPPSEFTYVDLLAIRKEVQCPICLGIIKKTRTVMECLHRFCRNCIDKSMRMGNNECPACRTHCASRRSLRDDPRFDELIAALYPDIKKFEEEELAFYDEDESRNKQIQDSIFQVIAKQTEALGKKRSGNKDSAGPSTARSQRIYRTTQSRRGRRRKRNGSTEYLYQDSDDYIDPNDSDKRLSPDEHHREPTQRKRKGRANVTMSRSPSTPNLSGGSLENNLDQGKEDRGFSPGLTCSPESLAWGRGGVRSTARHGNTNGSTNRNARCIRLAKLVDFLHNLEENDNECMGLGTPVKNESAQLMCMKDANGLSDHQSMLQPLSLNSENLSQVAESLQEKFHALDSEEKLSGVLTSCILHEEQMVSAYQQKEAI